jgi:hypothetical protein
MSENVANRRANVVTEVTNLFEKLLETAASVQLELDRLHTGFVETFYTAVRLSP